ncbi:cell division protein SepF [Peptostreptococcus equinus]|uniref:Cell division protein SepF n=1 Tax=Peptostreptococcus equinus TaxID=3003601 RepID=A0ABY7JQH8_9FIRM|nr:cell division protein SepF [Peptostreptococcus sp. CBA3647]WAW15611.1 cell division protein SepF [Peptostreptococcus sp. CBA3647]
MAGIKEKMGKIKNWMVIDEDHSEEEYEAYDEYDEVEDYENDYDEFDDDLNNLAYSGISSNRVPEYQSHNQMKVVIVEPKVYDDAATIADHLRLRKTVIVNLESMTQQNTKKSIFDFMNGAVYVLDGDIQRVSKSIFILAPKNVDIDANIKKELESKAIFPWQNSK